MERRGVTLLEVMVSVAILTIVMAAIFGLATSIGELSSVQHGKTEAIDEARYALQTIVRELRQSAGATISSLPAGVISYRAAVDADGNGVAVDVGGNLELSTPRTFTRDLDDINGDGVAGEQLIMIDGDTIRVLANDLMPDEDTNGNNILDTREDTNGNGKLDHGVWFEPWGDGIRVTVQAQTRTRKGHALPADLSEIVIPRN